MFKFEGLNKFTVLKSDLTFNVKANILLDIFLDEFNLLPHRISLFFLLRKTKNYLYVTLHTEKLFFVLKKKLIRFYPKKTLSCILYVTNYLDNWVCNLAFRHFNVEKDANVLYFNYLIFISLANWCLYRFRKAFWRFVSVGYVCPLEDIRDGIYSVYLSFDGPSLHVHLYYFYLYFNWCCFLSDQLIFLYRSTWLYKPGLYTVTVLWLNNCLVSFFSAQIKPIYLFRCVLRLLHRVLCILNKCLWGTFNYTFSKNSKSNKITVYKNSILVGSLNKTRSRFNGVILNSSCQKISGLGSTKLVYSTMRFSRFFNKTRFSRNRQVVFSIVQFGLFINIFFIFIGPSVYYQILPNMDFSVVLFVLVLFIQLKFVFSFLWYNDSLFYVITRPLIVLFYNR